MATPSKVRLKPSALAHMISATRDTITNNVSPVASVYSGTYIFSPDGSVVGIRLASGGSVPVSPPWKPDTTTVANDKPLDSIGNNLSRRGDGSYTGVSGPAEYYDVNAPTNSRSNTGSSEGGTLDFQNLESIVNGNNLVELEPLIPLIPDDVFIEFDIHTTDDEILLYYNAKATFDDGGGDFTHNFSTASYYARTTGVPISRSSWKEGELYIQWITYENGVWYSYTSDERKVIENNTLSEADYRAIDWKYPDSCNLVAISRPAIPTDADDSNQSTTPTFDIQNPPCSVWG